MAIILASRLPKIPLRAAIAHLFRLYLNICCQLESSKKYPLLATNVMNWDSPCICLTLFGRWLLRLYANVFTSVVPLKSPTEGKGSRIYADKHTSPALTRPVHSAIFNGNT